MTGIIFPVFLILLGIKLEETTSSIDTHTELLVHKGTSFVIAHRPSTIIDQGNIIEAEIHEEQWN